MSTASPVHQTTSPTRGRGLVASRTIKPGEIVLTDSPVLLYPSSLHSLSSFCSHCFRCLNSSPLKCPSCQISLFCSPLCLSLSHPSLLCSSLRYLPSTASDSILFLLSAYSLPSTSFSLLLSLQPSAAPDESLHFASECHSLLSSLIPLHLFPCHFALPTTAALLSKDKINAFALMSPFRPETTDRAVRAYGIYANAALFNHDCLPNACRFDYVDGVGVEKNNTDIVVRAIHEISEGREVCLSYFPVNWEFKERQARLKEYYGFVCECDRCQVESRWKEQAKDDEDMEEDELEDETEMEEEEDQDFPHAYFFLKFMCSKEGCGGTMAPLPPSSEGLLSDVMECNICGHMRKEDDDDNGDMVDS